MYLFEHLQIAIRNKYIVELMLDYSKKYKHLKILDPLILDAFWCIFQWSSIPRHCIKFDQIKLKLFFSKYSYYDYALFIQSKENIFHDRIIWSFKKLKLPPTHKIWKLHFFIIFLNLILKNRS